MNLMLSEPQRIPAAVHAFMMLQNRQHHHQGNVRQFFHHIIALRGMQLHLLHLIRRQLAWFVQDFSRYLALADIMHQTGKNKIP